MYKESISLPYGLFFNQKKGVEYRNDSEWMIGEVQLNAHDSSFKVLFEKVKKLDWLKNKLKSRLYEWLHFWTSLAGSI